MQNRKQEKQNILMSAFYGYIGEHHVDNICDEIDSLKEEIDKIEIPETLDDWFDGYVKNARKKDNQKRINVKMRSISSKTAVILLVLFLSFVTLTFSVEAFRIQVFNLLFMDHDEYSNVKIEREPAEDKTIIEWDHYYYPAYIPEGFYIESVSDLANVRQIKFRNSSGKYIDFTQIPNGTYVSLDTEGGEKKDVEIENRKAVLTVKEGKNILFWNNEEYSFYLTSNLELEKLIFIAESLEKK